MRRLILSVLTVFLVFVDPVFSEGPGTKGEEARGSLRLEYSQGFSIEYRQGYKLLEVKAPWPGSKRGFTYVLYARGDPKPRGLKADGFFETPLRRAVSFSTTYLPQIVAAGGLESIVGVDNAAYVSSPEVRGRIAAGKTVETTRNYVPNIELLIALSPDAIFTYGMGNEWDNHPKMAEAGLPVVISGEWNETDPLARAEWQLFIAAFYDAEVPAKARFDATAKEYERIRKLAAAAGSKPRVLVNGPFQGSWAVSGGKSYMATFLKDAGASYLWADDPSTGGQTLSIEAVYARALKADYWLNPALSVKKAADIAALDSRFMALPAVAGGRVWNNNLRMGPEGGNDYFESAVLYPDKVLADLVKIFHPGLLADRAFTYYKRVE
jgi:iron complex transport system substrate-binding protein